MTLQGHVFCLLVADVANNSRLYEKLGDIQARRTMAQCLLGVEQVAIRHGARVLKTVGDQVLLAFGTADQGLLAACEIQRWNAAVPPIAGIGLRIRLGLHHGPVLEDAGDVFGDTVHTASGLATMASSQHVLVSAQVLAAIPQPLPVSVGPLKSVLIKGKREPVTVAELLWQEGAGLTPPTDSFPDTEPLGLRLRLRYRGRQELFLDVHRPTLSLGRGQGNDLVIRDAQASRTHAQIEFRHSCFVLMDQSSNGTYVATEEGGSLLVKRDEIVLCGRGRLSFGHPWAEGQAEFVDYLLLD